MKTSTAPLSPLRVEIADWPLRIARPYWVLAPEPIPARVKAGRVPFRLLKSFRTPEARNDWLRTHGYLGHTA